jgi:hypothetical protein
MQGFMGELYTKPNPQYESDLTFKALALKQHLEERHIPLTQELQAIKYLKQHNISYQQVQ